jgi:hypothetical protein
VARAADARATDWLVSAREVARDVGAGEMALVAAEAGKASGGAGGGTAMGTPGAGGKVGEQSGEEDDRVGLYKL